MVKNSLWSIVLHLSHTITLLSIAKPQSHHYVFKSQLGVEIILNGTSKHEIFLAY